MVKRRTEHKSRVEENQQYRGRYPVIAGFVLNSSDEEDDGDLPNHRFRNSENQVWSCDLRHVSLSLLVVVIFMIVILVVVVMVMSLVIAMIASAGILFVVACRAIHEIQVEFLDHGFRIGRRLDLNNNGEVVALREGSLRD